MDQKDEEQSVQFFHNSSSSFNSSAISSSNQSRYHSLTDEIIFQTEKIQQKLQAELKISQNQQNRSAMATIQIIANRAKIMFRSIIPEHIEYLRSIKSPISLIQNLNKQLQSMKKISSDFQKYQNNQITYQKFYEENKSRKKCQISEVGKDIFLQPDTVKVMSINNKTLKGVIKILKYQDTQQSKQKIQRLILQSKKLRKQFLIQSNQQKIQTEQRINKILNLQSIDSKPYNQELSDLKKELIQSKQLNVQVLEKYQESLNDNKILQNTINTYKQDNKRLQNQLKFTQNKFDENQFSVNEVNDHNQAVKILTRQKILLRQQLKRERSLLDQNRQKAKQDLNEIQLKFNRVVKEKNKQIQILNNELDKYRVQRVEVKSQNNHSVRLIKQLKQQNNTLRKKIPTEVETSNQIPFDQKSSQKKKLISIEHYSGKGIEGERYYEILSRQFQIRFRRACLMKKQLLLKDKGFEVGVIDQSIAPNIIKLKIYLTNYGNVEFNELTIKAISPINNNLTINVEQNIKMLPGQQIKVPLSCQVSHYPIGPVVLICEYVIDGNHQILRILLPVHIFKIVVIEPRREPLTNPTQEKILLEHKIAKNIQGLSKIFRGIKSQKGIFSVLIIHEHTNSRLGLNLSQNKQSLLLQFQHLSGNPDITSYFLQTFMALLEKNYHQYY